MDDRKEVVYDFINNRIPSRVPTGFWHHFVSFRNHHMGLKDPNVLKAVIKGQKEFIDKVKPDFVKIMSDGFFGHPAVLDNSIETVDDLQKIKSNGESHPWIDEQVSYVKEICNYVNGQIYTYYNIFSPLQYIRLKFEEFDENFEIFTKLFLEEPQAMNDAAEEIEKDLKILVERLFSETNLDGVYYSVQSVQSTKVDHTLHQEFVEPSDLLVLNHINQFSDNIMLHICGYGHYTNDLSWYANYPVKVFNWATATENVSLKEGKQIFNGKPVLGGFDNNLGSILYSGSNEELKSTIFNILDDAGTRGVALGADCTIDPSIEIARLDKIRDIAKAYSTK